MTFSYGDFYFQITGANTCRIGINNSKDANGPISEKEYKGPAVIPSIAVDSTNKKYIVRETSRSCFRNCQSLVFITLPETLRFIGWDTFYGTSIETLVIPKSVETANFSAFSHMYSLRSIIFEPGSKIKTMGQYSLNGNAKLTKVVFPPSLSSMGYLFFLYITTLEIVYCGRTQINNNIFHSSNTNFSIYVTNSYQSTNFGGKTASKLPSGDNSCIPYFEFYRQKSINCPKGRSSTHVLVFVMIVLS